MLNSLTTIFLGPYDMISKQISIFFDWLVSKGVREDTLIIILVAGGISLLLLVLGLLLALFKFLRKNAKKSKKPAKSTESKKTKNTQMSEATSVKGPDPRFAIFKKRKNKKAKQVSAEAPVLDQNVAVLTEIERDMLALKELFDAGHIDAKVYVEETRKLYDKAQQLI